MFSMLLLAGLAASSPLEARVTAIDVERSVGVGNVWYNKVDMEIESPDERRLRLCPSDVSVLTERRVGEEFVPVDRFRSHAMQLESARSYTGSCREIVLAAGRPQTVTFFVSAVPGGRHRGRVDLDRDAAASPP